MTPIRVSEEDLITVMIGIDPLESYEQVHDAASRRMGAEPSFVWLSRDDPNWGEHACERLDRRGIVNRGRAGAGSRGCRGPS